MLPALSTGAASPWALHLDSEPHRRLAKGHRLYHVQRVPPMEPVAELRTKLAPALPARLLSGLCPFTLLVYNYRSGKSVITVTVRCDLNNQSKYTDLIFWNPECGEHLRGAIAPLWAVPSAPDRELVSRPRNYCAPCLSSISVAPVTEPRVTGHRGGSLDPGTIHECWPAPERSGYYNNG